MKTITRAQLNQALLDAGFERTTHGNQTFFNKEYRDFTASVHVINRTLTFFPKHGHFIVYRCKTTTDLAKELQIGGLIKSIVSIFA